MDVNVHEMSYFRFEDDPLLSGTWKPYNENKFELIKPDMGRSTTAKVDLVVHKQSGFLGAMKIYSKHLSKLQAEVNTLMVARDCPFLLHLIDRFVAADDSPDGASSAAAGAGLKKYYVLLEYATFGTLDGLTRAVGGVGSEKSRFYITEIASGLKFLHSKNIMHRDVKPENMLLRADGHVVLGDFGLARDSTTRCCSICGAYVTRPPEVFLNKTYSLPVDAWMCGVSLYNIITNKWPFLSAVKEKHLLLLKTAKLPAEPRLSEESSDLLRRMLRPDPSERITISNVLEHPYITNLGQPHIPPYTPTELLATLPFNETDRQLIKRLI